MAAQNLSRSGMTHLASAAMQWLDGPRKRVPSDFGASPRVGYDASVQQRIGLGMGMRVPSASARPRAAVAGRPRVTRGTGWGLATECRNPTNPPMDLSTAPSHTPTQTPAPATTMLMKVVRAASAAVG